MLKEVGITLLTVVTCVTGFFTTIYAESQGELMFKKITTNLMVNDVQETLSYYRDVLGFELVGAVTCDQEFLPNPAPDMPLAFAILKRDEAQLMVQSQKSLSQDLPCFKGMPVGRSISLYMEVDQVMAIYERLKDKVEIVKDLHKTFYGMDEFYIKDCNGYVLAFDSKVQ